MNVTSPDLLQGRHNQEAVLGIFSTAIAAPEINSVQSIRRGVLMTQQVWSEH